MKRPNLGQKENLMRPSDTLGIGIGQLDPMYPGRLRRLVDKPHALWVRGEMPTFRNAVAFVGARACTSYGEHVTMQLVNELPQDTLIVSGGAYGIDAAAHRAALARGMKTVAFLAGGVDRFYPAGHTEMFLRIIESGGAVISEHAPGTAPTRFAFLQRNRLIAAVSHAVIVVEAGFRSGSLNTAGWAERMVIPLGAVPGPITSVASAGTNRLIHDRRATAVTSGEDILALAPHLGAEGA